MNPLRVLSMKRCTGNLWWEMTFSFGNVHLMLACSELLHLSIGEATPKSPELSNPTRNIGDKLVSIIQAAAQHEGGVRETFGGGVCGIGGGDGRVFYWLDTIHGGGVVLQPAREVCGGDEATRGTALLHNLLMDSKSNEIDSFGGQTEELPYPLGTYKLIASGASALSTADIVL